MSVVYFIRSSSDTIKIGWTADLPRRLQNLASSTADTLEVVASTPGDAALEQHFHERFAIFRLRGEWFSCSPDLMQLIETIASGRYAAPAGFEVQDKPTRCFNLIEAHRAAQEEGHRLIRIIAGEGSMGDKVKAGLFRVAAATGLGDRRVRAIWNREARVIACEEMDRLRQVAAKLAPWVEDPP